MSKPMVRGGKKLGLNKETLRTLNTSDLSAVVGGSNIVVKATALLAVCNQPTGGIANHSMQVIGGCPSSIVLPNPSIFQQP